LGLDYIIQYKKGVDNKAADALSRRAHDQNNSQLVAVTEIVLTWLEDLKQSYINDVCASKVLNDQLDAVGNKDEVTVYHGVIRK
jgi:hypothetical protein